MNPYQRLPGIQKGRIDTAGKFEQMVGGIDLKGLRVLDVGCNLGEMSRLLAAAGAKVLGIDKTEKFILQAMPLTTGSNPSFSVQDGYHARGVFDLAILSACFHYFQDPRRLLKQLARVTTRVRMDVWIHDGEGMILSDRGLLIPSQGLVHQLAYLEGWDSCCHGPVLSPNKSTRLLFDLVRFSRTAPNVKIIYGPSRTGKTTQGKRLSIHGYHHIQLDQVWSAWNRKQNRHLWSVSRQTEKLLGTPKWEEYLSFVRVFLRRTLLRKITGDLVIEGYSAWNEDYRAMLHEELRRLGWESIEEIELKREPQ